MTQAELRVGLVGAGYIAGWHAAVLAQMPGVTLAAVCDPAQSAAEALAGAHGARAFASLEAMLEGGAIDAVHILTPPHLHHDLAVQALAAGVHVLVEKPFATTRDEAAAMVAAAKDAGRKIAVNHNFLGLPACARLRAAQAQGLLGRIDSAEIHWRLPLPPLRSGPYGMWMLQRPANLMLELGPHLHAFAHDLFGPLEVTHLRLSKLQRLPTGVTLPQCWTVLGRAGETDVTLSVSLIEGIDDRSVTLRGTAGMARLDFAADTLVLTRENTSDIVMNPLVRELSQARQHLREGLRNARVQLGSLNRRQPYALGFQGVFAGFYDAIRRDTPVPDALSGESAVAVMAAVESVCAQIPADISPAPPAAVPAPAMSDAPPDALVIGGTGFLGRELVQQLVARGQRVGVLSRARANPFADLGAQVTLVPAALNDPAAVQKAMAGVGTVYHLARAEAASWEGYLKDDVAVTEALGQAALAAGVRRFVYTGTIASYDASNPGQTITEATEFGDMSRRNLYARSKALCEARLLALHRDHGLPLVIARPGIVVGPGGPLQHWGIGRWHGAGAVRIWGDGTNKLPFVLNSDVADGLIRMSQAEGIEGESFNLVGPPLMSAQGWFEAMARQTGSRVVVSKGNLTTYWLADWVKYGLKRYALRRAGLSRPLLADWRSRAHLARFSNARACEVLGWKPVDDAGEFGRRALAPAALFGF